MSFPGNGQCSRNCLARFFSKDDGNMDPGQGEKAPPFLGGRRGCTGSTFPFLALCLVDATPRSAQARPGQAGRGLAKSQQPQGPRTRKVAPASAASEMRKLVKSPADVGKWSSRWRISLPLRRRPANAHRPALKPLSLSQCGGEVCQGARRLYFPRFQSQPADN